jgi:hypothetical protein
MYEEHLQRVAARLARWGDKLQPPCSEEAIVELKRKSRITLSTDVPEGYIEFLRMTDGLEWDGLMIYASATSPIVGHQDKTIEGFVEANDLWRSYKPHRKYLFFGESGTSLYALNLVGGRFELQDRATGTVFETWRTFDELIASALGP